MRRTTANCASVAEEQRRLLAGLDDENALSVACVLEDLVTAERAARLKSVFAQRLDSVTVLMDAPHDPHNGAAVIRSCDAFGVQRLHIIERLETFLAARTVARGSERWVDVHTYSRSADAIATLRASGHVPIATHPNGELSPSDLQSLPRIALVLGNERDGIHSELQAACERSVRIPMRGFTESLNVSVTAAILLEHAARGRAGDLTHLEKTRLYARALALTVPRAAEILAAKGILIGETSVLPLGPA